MMKKFIVLLLISGLLLTACGGENVPPAESPDVGAPPLPDNGGSPETPIINLPGEPRFQDQEPAPGQAEWARGNAFVNDTQLAIMESFPIQVMLTLEGELPTPCNYLTIDIAAPDADNTINVEVYSLVSPAETCIQVIEPFSENISLPTGELADGTYAIFVNGEKVGEFTYPGG